MAIGVFDSGLGGLTVLRALRDTLPNQPFVYLGDNANAPYGEQSQEVVQALTEAGVARLFDAGCRLAIVACNTASALALRPIQQQWLPRHAPGRRVLGVFAPVVEAVVGRAWSHAGPAGPALDRRQKLLFFATSATVRSGAFEREAAARAHDLEVESEACPGLVDALERGGDDAAEAIARAAVDRALERTARRWGGAPDAAVLGCTHYPLVERAFRRALPPETELLSQPGIVAGALARYLFRHPEFESSGPEPRLVCLTSGEPATADAAARRLFGWSAPFAAA